MNQKKAIIITVVALAFLSLFIIVDNSKKGGLGGQYVSPNILNITQPVTSISGIVEKIEGNTVLISNRYTLLQTAPVVITVLPGQSPIMPTPKVVTTTYKAVITGKTQITQPPAYINYLFKTDTQAVVQKLTIKDVKVGQYITVNSMADLRTLEGTVFEATTINLPQKMSALNGKISRLDGNTLILKAFPPTNSAYMTTTTGSIAPKEKEYAIIITSDTEISRAAYSDASAPPKTEKLGLSDLKKDMQAVVYTDEDVTEGKGITALRIEPIVTMSVPLVIPTPVTSSPQAPSPSVAPTTSATASPTP